MTDAHPALSRRALLGGAASSLALPAAVAAPPAAAHPAAADGTPRRRGTVVLTDDFRPVPGWSRQGVVMRTDLPWESSLLQDPCLVHDSGTGPVFKLWYGSLHGIGYATSQDGRRWEKATEPVLAPTLDSETSALNQPSVVPHDGVWHMTYFGVDGAGAGRIHHASARSPEGPWTKHGVVLTSTAPWEDDFLYNSSLMYDTDEKLWKMWYTAGKIASAGGEPRYVCYATADRPGGPWRKHPANPVLRPMDDGGWASLGVGGPNVRKLGPGRYETRLVGWQADYPSRGGRLLSPDGIHWELERTALELDLGVVDGDEDGMVYRQFAVVHEGREHLFYNVKNNRPGWNETIQLAVRQDAVEIVDPSKWTMTHGVGIPTGASFEVREQGAWSLGNAPAARPQTLQGNVEIDAPDYEVRVSVTPHGEAPAGHDHDHVILARMTGRDSYYYAGLGSWGHAFGIGVMEKGRNRKLVGTGSAGAIEPGRRYDLRFVLDGKDLQLHADGRLVLRVEDPTLVPQRGCVGLQTSNGAARAKFSRLSVTLR
ncbi:hypothetical protein ACFXKG_16665 [Streptomyces sp. NPDC059255]|uniref:hypothetical protein n=1 Tax=Streptomyces sp. NPDC059255 TaxID=3346793 RepID=UPI00367A78E8